MRVTEEPTHGVCYRFKFEAAHRLLDYPGKCHNIHGHNYTVEICLEPSKNDSGLGLDSQFMVMDFNHFKGLAQVIRNLWDHKLLLNSNDPLLELLMQTTQIYTFLDVNPTAEVMAEFIAGFVADGYNAHARIIVRVWETDNAYAIATVRSTPDLEGN